MGWWGYGVVDGDGPWDIIADIEEEADINNDDSDDEEGSEALDLEKLFLEQRQAFKKLSIDTMKAIAIDASHDGDSVAIMTVGYLFLKWQVTMPEDLKQEVLQAIAEDESDNWNDADERRKQLAAFKAAVEKQDGEGLSICGLFWSDNLPKREHFD